MVRNNTCFGMQNVTLVGLAILSTALTDAVPLSEGHMPKDRMQQMPATVQHEVQEVNITRPVGQNVTVKFSPPGNLDIKAVKVTRDDLGDKYVAYFRDGHMDPDNQNRSFQNRVELLIKQGNLFFSMRNVSSTDEGTYRISIKYKEGTIQTKHIYNFNLMTAPASVASAGNILKDNGRFGSIAAVVVVAVVVVVVVVVVFVVAVVAVVVVRLGFKKN